MWFNNEKIFQDIVYKKLSYDEEIELIDKAQEGDRKAMDKLVRSKVLLVISLIFNEFGKVYRGVPTEDLVAEGCIGIMNAIMKYDKSKNIKLSSYCKYWIQGSIQKSFNKQSRVISYPSGVITNHAKVYNSLLNLEKNSTEVTIDDIVNDTGLPKYVVEGVFSFCVYNKSFDADVNGKTLYDTYYDDEFDTLERFELNDTLEKRIYPYITDDEKELIHMYYYDCMLYREIAKKFGRGRNDIQRRIENIFKRIRQRMNAITLCDLIS